MPRLPLRPTTSRVQRLQARAAMWHCHINMIRPAGISPPPTHTTTLTAHRLYAIVTAVVTAALLSKAATTTAQSNPTYAKQRNYATYAHSPHDTARHARKTNIAALCTLNKYRRLLGIAKVKQTRFITARQRRMNKQTHQGTLARVKDDLKHWKITLHTQQLQQWKRSLYGTLMLPRLEGQLREIAEALKLIEDNIPSTKQHPCTNKPDDAAANDDNPTPTDPAPSISPPAINSTSFTKPTAQPVKGGGHAFQSRRHQQLPPPGTWVQPSAVGLYCEKQVGEHCGAHALNALLGRAALTPATAYMVRALISSTARASMLAAIPSDLFNQQGQYDIRAINLWLYEHTNAQYMILPFLYIREPGMNKSAVLSAAPPGCRAIYIQYEHTTTDGQHMQHYKAWMKSTDAQSQPHDHVRTDAGMSVKALLSLNMVKLDN
ncbi:hypothetical protein COO60DRAFT_776969 [Scenedesmus sp. NREL 46B-D3]|nr:hypothetical protein COO60DRAFT_776969 [Scenedesmus sp. NREL 46B-D3]